MPYNQFQYIPLMFILKRLYSSMLIALVNIAGSFVKSENVSSQRQAGLLPGRVSYMNVCMTHVLSQRGICCRGIICLRWLTILIVSGLRIPFQLLISFCSPPKSLPLAILQIHCLKVYLYVPTNI